MVFIISFNKMRFYPIQYNVYAGKKRYMKARFFRQIQFLFLKNKLYKFNFLFIFYYILYSP